MCVGLYFVTFLLIFRRIDETLFAMAGLGKILIGIKEGCIYDCFGEKLEVFFLEHKAYFEKKNIDTINLVGMDMTTGNVKYWLNQECSLEISEAIEALFMSCVDKCASNASLKNPESIA